MTRAVGLAALALLALPACEAGFAPTPGVTAAFAEAATAVPSACGLSEAQLGPAIDSAAGYVVHDTAPNTVAPRTHYITGFADGCARPVTGALVMFGDLATHETTRYGASAVAYSPTDAAYERIKSQVCGAGPGQPCGTRLAQLAQDTVFVSVYPVFGAEGHTDLLLHDGDLVAVDEG